jgi:FkbM family methyltransferase
MIEGDCCVRRIFIDVGANVGDVALKFANEHPDFDDIYCIEANRILIPHIVHRMGQANRPFIIIWGAAWISDGRIDLYESGPSAAATVMLGKIEKNGWPQIDYKKGVSVPCFDFSAWLQRTISPSDHVVVKFNIEGAEYPLLERMIENGSLRLISRLMCKWHIGHFPDVAQQRHEEIIKAAQAMTSVN